MRLIGTKPLNQNKMTPKEKAKELVDKFSDLEDGEMYIGKAKQCALIAVELMLEETPMYTGLLNPKWIFWNRVMDELEKL